MLRNDWRGDNKVGFRIVLSGLDHSDVVNLGLDVSVLMSMVYLK